MLHVAMWVAKHTRARCRRQSHRGPCGMARKNKKKSGRVGMPVIQRGGLAGIIACGVAPGLSPDSAGEASQYTGTTGASLNSLGSAYFGVAAPMTVSSASHRAHRPDGSRHSRDKADLARYTRLRPYGGEGPEEPSRWAYSADSAAPRSVAPN